MGEVVGTDNKMMETPSETNELLKRLIALEEAHLAAYTKASNELNELQRKGLSNQERAIRLYRRFAGVALLITTTCVLWYAYEIWAWYTQGTGGQ